jgi:DNA-binding transcriptional LysR family regulator
MTLEQLRVFVAVAERLHMTQGAAAMNMTQSAASAAIQALEARIGMPLFNRVGRRIELTDAGRTLLPEARAILGRVGVAEQVLADLGGLDRGRLSLWASQTIAGYWLPPSIVRFRRAHPKVAVSLAIGNTTEVARAVSDGEADLGFVEGLVDDPLLACIDVGTDQLVMVTAAGAVEDPTRADAADLARFDWVLREQGSGTRQVFETAIRAYGFEPNQLSIVLELPSNEAVRGAVEAGAGATVISRLVVEAGLAAGRLVELPIGFPARRFTAIRHGDRHRSRAETAFLAMLRHAPGSAVH